MTAPITTIHCHATGMPLEAERLFIEAQISGMRARLAMLDGRIITSDLHDACALRSRDRFHDMMQASRPAPVAVAIRTTGNNSGDAA